MKHIEIEDIVYRFGGWIIGTLFVIFGIAVVMAYLTY